MSSWAAPVAATPVRGHVVVPGSKSASARSLVLAALAEGESVLTGVLQARDTALMQAGLATLGAGFQQLADGRVLVRPALPLTGGGVVDCGLAGTVMRFLPPLAALASPPTSFTGDEAARRKAELQRDARATAGDAAKLARKSVRKARRTVEGVLS